MVLRLALKAMVVSTIVLNTACNFHHAMSIVNCLCTKWAQLTWSYVDWAPIRILSKVVSLKRIPDKPSLTYTGPLYEGNLRNLSSVTFATTQLCDTRIATRTTEIARS